MQPGSKISVVLPTHNPDRERFGRTLAGLRAQTLSASHWELLVVDNASSPPVSLENQAPTGARVVVETTAGLTAARLRGFKETTAEFIVMVDDDNVLSPAYLEQVLALFSANPRIGALGGRSLPEFAHEPESWKREFFGLLALRDLGEKAITSSHPQTTGAPSPDYPGCAPIGAGMALRRSALQPWIEATQTSSAITDRRGNELTSGGDNDIVFSILAGGWEVGYFPVLSLTHLIPDSRLTPAYLGRLNRGIRKSWMQVLRRHGANPWAPIHPWTLPLRKAKAWFNYRAWSSPAARIRWQGACGQFEGLANRDSRP